MEGMKSRNSQQIQCTSPLFRIQRILTLSNAIHTIPRYQIQAMAVYTSDRTNIFAYAITSKDTIDNIPNAHYILIRTMENKDIKYWRIPICSFSNIESNCNEAITALEFSPEGDYLIALSKRRNRLHVLPFDNLILKYRQDKANQLDGYQLQHVPTSYAIQMISYLRTNTQEHSSNLGRYKSIVSGDNELSSQLYFDMNTFGQVECLKWWRSIHGKDYCLVGSSENLISIINIMENIEVCRCELLNAGKIISIDLFHEKFRHETRTSMLIKSENQVLLESGMKQKTLTQFYRVVLEKQYEDRKTGELILHTFPEHFVEDRDFRPRKLKKQLPYVRFYALNSHLSRDSSLAMYDPTTEKLAIFTNLQWNLKAEYTVPSLHLGQDQEKERMDIQILFCSSDLLLLQETYMDGTSQAAWLSLPSRHIGNALDFSEQILASNIVHILLTHGNEKIERVMQTTDIHGGITYLLQTRHHVYECQPQWNRLSLFKSLCQRRIAIDDALSIGYALGIDMPSLCEVVADQLCTETLESNKSVQTNNELSQNNDHEEMIKWVNQLYTLSRVMPSKAIENLSQIGGVAIAIKYALRVLNTNDKENHDVENDQSTEMEVWWDNTAERAIVARLLVQLIFQEQQKMHKLKSEDSKSHPYPWFRPFIKNNKDYDANEIILLCLSYHHVGAAFRIGIARSCVSYVLDQIVKHGLTGPSCVSNAVVQMLLEANEGEALTEPEHRLLFRSLSLSCQLSVLFAVHVQSNRILTASDSVIFQQRDWLIRQLPAMSWTEIHQLRQFIDLSKYKYDTSIRSNSQETRISDVKYAGVASSESISVSRQEHVEFFLTVLLQICNTGTQLANQNELNNAFSFTKMVKQTQKDLEKYLITLKGEYRSIVLAHRCIDYKNWAATACLYEANEEYDASMSFRMKLFQKQANEARETNTEDTFKNGLQDTLQEYIDTYILSGFKLNGNENSQLQATLLGKILLTWCQYDLAIHDFEVFCQANDNFIKIAPILSLILFSTDPNQIYAHCQQIKFSGIFLATLTMSVWNANQIEREGLLQRTKDLKLRVLENIQETQNDKFLHIPSTSADKIGKSDPLETHVKVFSCGHYMSKRIFDEEMMLKFEKQLNQITIPLLQTKAWMKNEYYNPISKIISAPCPNCTIQKIERLIETQTKN